MDLRDASLGFYRVWFAAVGARTGLLAHFAEHARTTAHAARALSLDEPMVARWCRGAHALGLLTRSRDERFYVARQHRAALTDPGSPEYLGHHFHYLARKSLHFGALDDLMRGKAADEDLTDVYAIATGWDHVAFFERVVPRDAEVRRILQRGGTALDLGAGLGRWSAEAKRRFPRARIVAAEAKGEPLRRLRAAALRGVDVVALGAVEDAAFDLVFMGEVLSAAPSPTEALAGARDALKPGGALRALEGLAPRRGAKPRGWGARLVLAMDLDFALDGSRFLTLDEAKAALREAGLAHRRARDLGGSLYLLSARKRETGRKR